ncbi:unnamed protein product, partial [Commensalibacter communis]
MQQFPQFIPLTGRFWHLPKPNNQRTNRHYRCHYSNHVPRY